MEDPCEARGFEVDVIFRATVFVGEERGECEGCQYEKKWHTLPEIHIEGHFTTLWSR
jgi:hypothetical protein